MKTLCHHKFNEMEITKNKLKEAFKHKPVLYGAWNGIPNTYVAEILAGSGFDWILIDAEHGPFDLNSVIYQLQAFGQFDIPVLVRPHEGNENYIKQLLDAGVQTLLIPMVETAEQAEKMVQAMQYPPSGIRGVGTALARAAQWNRVNNYFHEANDQMCLIVQVENAAGIKKLDEILSVEGVDGVFIGPADLAASMGFIGQPDKPEVKQTVEAALKKIRNAGKISGVMAIAKPLAEHYIKCGANMVAIAIDTLLLAKAATDTAAGYQTESIEKQSNTKY
jgi:4-hydroxy-2-oxoheptanedioate aldolase